MMKKQFLPFLAALLLTLPLPVAAFSAGRDTTAPRAGEGAVSAASPSPQAEVIKMGVITSRDSSRYSGRTFPVRLFMARGDWSLGIQATSFSVSSANSQYLMLLTGVNGAFGFTRVAPYFAYTYKDNLSVGMRLTYLNMRGALGQGTLDLLNDGLKFTIEDTNARLQSYGGDVFHRYYVGLDDLGRCGLLFDLSLSYAHSRIDFTSGAAAGNFGRTDQIALTFAPGVEIFFLNNLSMQVSIGMADISYSWARSYRNFEETGRNSGFSARTQLNLLALNFGLTFHL